jgi:hypothetical protein
MKPKFSIRGILGAAVLCLSFLSVRADDLIQKPIGPFGTLNNRDNSYAIGADRAQDLLNVNIIQGGKSVKKRSGFGTAFTLSNATSPVHGSYIFFDASGNDVVLAFNDRNINASINGGSMSRIYSTGTFGATYQCVDSLGIAYCADSFRTALYKTQGTSVGKISGIISTGTMVVVGPTRLAMAGFSDRPSAIDWSAATDFTTWGTGSLGTSGVQLTINAPGAKITHLVYAFGKWIWFKDSSFGFVIEGNQPLQTDWVTKTVAFDVGTNDNTSIYREGVLYFRGQDGHIYAFDGSTYQRASREIAGTINLTQNRISNSWTQTTQSDFQAGATSPGGWIDTGTISGQMSLSTAAPISSFSDAAPSDFASGTLTQVSTNVNVGDLLLSFSTQYNLNSQAVGTGGEVCTDECTGPYYQSQSFTSTVFKSNALLSSLTLNLQKVGSPGDYTLSFKSDGGGVPGTTLENISVPAASISTSSGIYVVNFASTTRLLNGTTYFAQLIPTGTCNSSNKIIWRGQSGVGTTISNGCGSAATSSFIRYQYTLYTTTFNASGNIVSRSFDTGFTTNTWLWGWGTVTATKIVPTNTTLTFETQTSSSTNGAWESLTSVVSGSSATSTVQEFIRYKASFTTVDQSTSSNLNDITIGNSMRTRPSAVFYSQVKNAPSLTSWDTLTQTITGGHTYNHTFYIRSSTNTITVLSSTPSWTSVGYGAIPSISTGSYFQVRDDFFILTFDEAPVLYDFTQNWFEGLASDKMYATYFDDKLWFSVTNGTGATTNNKELVYDLVSNGWTLYDIPSNGFYIRQNKLYFGSTSDGHIYKYGDINSDNGSAINSYWKSKDFFGVDPFTQEEISNISITAASVANSSMTVTYAVDGSSVSTYTMPLYNPRGNFATKNKNLPAGRVGYQYSIQFGNNAADQSFEVFGLQVGIRPKPWTTAP